MTKKNAKKVSKVSLGHVPMFLLWVTLAALTLLRLLVAHFGSLGESEALLSVCGSHPAGGYVEGPCGLPFLAAFLLAVKPFLGVSALVVLRSVSPLAALLLSWCVWWIAHRLAPHRPALALWSVIAVNVLPWVNLASLVLDGALVTASLVLLCMVSGWSAEELPVKGRQSILPCFLFGLALAVTTLFYYPIGWLFPLAVAVRLYRQGVKRFSWKGASITFVLLILGWIFPLYWNARHDWIQWSSVARGFDSYAVGGCTLSLSICIALSALIVPALVFLAAEGVWWRRVMTLLLLVAVLGSGWVFAMPSRLPENAPSPLGVQGVGELAREVVALRKERPDAKGEESFLIAQSSGLAALLGEKIILAYPDRPGAPSVFVAESPSMNSSYALWPSYADADAPTVKDILYSEEKTASPFLGRNALYITAEAPNELPQTIKGAFGAVGLLQEVPLTKNGESEVIRIYQCETYRGLSL